MRNRTEYHKQYYQDNIYELREKNRLWMKAYRAGKVKVKKLPVPKKKEESRVGFCPICGIWLKSPCAGKVRNGRCEGCNKITACG